MTTTLFCLDFDETLMNTDRLRADLLEAIRRLGKEELATTYQEAYETTRELFGIPRLPLVFKTMVERYELDFELHRQLAALFHEFSYQNYLYPGAEETIHYLKQRGSVLIFSDGDSFFQPQKIQATGVAQLVDQVIVLPHKVDYFNDLSGYWPAEHYVFIDDKQTVLDAAKKHFGDQATTLLVRQGRYATQHAAGTADITADAIADVPSLLADTRSFM